MISSGQVNSQSLLLYRCWLISHLNMIGYTTYNLYFHTRITFLIYLGSQMSKTMYISSPYLSHTLKHTMLHNSHNIVVLTLYLILIDHLLWYTILCQYKNSSDNPPHLDNIKFNSTFSTNLFLTLISKYPELAAR